MSAYAMANAMMQPDLTPIQKIVYAHLIFRANGARVCWPSVSEIAADLDISERRVMMATKVLQGCLDEACKCRKGVSCGKIVRIKVTPRHKATNNYFILDVPGLYDLPVWSRRKRSAERTPMPYDDDEADLTKTKGDENDRVEPIGDENDTQAPEFTLTQTTSWGDENDTPLVQQESNKGSTSLRSAPDVRAEVFTEGLQIIRSLTGKPEGGSRRLLGQMCKTAGDDCARVMAALRNALDHRPAEPVSFILGSLRPRSTFETIHAKLGTTSLWATINDDDDVLEGELP